MDEGIRMTVVINPVITPLLFDALTNDDHVAGLLAAVMRRGLK